MTPRCVILTSTYSTNKLKYLRQAVDSVKAQTEKDWLWQVVLDGSDREVEAWVMSNLFNEMDDHVRVWRCSTTTEERRRVYRPAVIFNEHMARLTEWFPAAYFMWLSDDDLLLPNCLQDLVDELDKGEHQVVYGGYEVTEELAGEHVHKAVVGSTKDFGPGIHEHGQWLDPMGKLDSGAIMQTAQSFKTINGRDGKAVPEGWETAMHCDGIYLQKLARSFHLKGIGKQIMKKRQTRWSTHARPAL